jgi:3-hydroxyisobutyrate dehydrogenase
MKKTIGWIGTGVMGNSMCLHLLKSGYPLNIYNRTKSKA